MSYVNPGSILAMGITFPTLGVVAVALRFYTRQIQKAKLAADDWCELIIPSLLFMVGIGISLIDTPKKWSDIQHLGRLVTWIMDAISPEIALSSQIEWAILILQTLSLGFAKLSIVYFYRRIFCVFGMRTVFDVATKAFIVITIAWTIAFTLAFIFTCGTHVSAIWGPWDALVAECDNAQQADLAYTISDLIMDIVIFIMPIPMTWRLHMTTSRRIAVTAIFVLGALAIIASILRVAFLGLVLHSIYSSLISQDRDLDTAIFLYWTMLETGIAVIVACLPTFQFLSQRVSPEGIIRSVRSLVSLRSSSTHGSEHSKSAYNRDQTENDRKFSTSAHSENLHLTDYPGTVSSYASHGIHDLERDCSIPSGKVRMETMISQRSE